MDPLDERSDYAATEFDHLGKPDGRVSTRKFLPAHKCLPTGTLLRRKTTNAKNRYARIFYDGGASWFLVYFGRPGETVSTPVPRHEWEIDADQPPDDPSSDLPP